MKSKYQATLKNIGDILYSTALNIQPRFFLDSFCKNKPAHPPVSMGSSLVFNKGSDYRHPGELLKLISLTQY